MKHSYLLVAAMFAAFIAAGCSPKTAPESAAAQQESTETPYVSVRTDVPNKAYYKDVFVHGGLQLSAHKDLPSFAKLGLTYEYIAIDDPTPGNCKLQNSIFNSNPDDANGVLLYPDGEPRYSMVYVNGGGANAAGRKLEEQGRRNFKQFISAGGSYVGSCAGAYLVSESEDRTSFGGYFGIWPGDCSGAVTGSWPVRYLIPEGSPLRKYGNFGGDFAVDSVIHHNGPFFERWYEVPGTEVLALNDYPKYMFHMKPSVIAYKENCYKGRIIPIGGHPEMEKTGERLDLMASIVSYAIEGRGCAKAKGILSNGEMRRMTKSTEDNDPAHTKIGDKQCHHFVFALPEKAKNIVIRLESLEDYELSLRLANGTYAFKEDAKYAKEGKELVKELKFDKLPAGTWYIGVQCENTVEATKLDTHFIYSNTAILNGAPYTISVKWDTCEIGRAVLRNGVDVNELCKKMVKARLVAGDHDSTITRIVFKTSSDLAEGIRVDDPAVSEEPIWASIDNGVLTFSTKAAAISTGRHPSFLFSAFDSLEKIENLDALDTEEAYSLNDLFKNCSKLGNLDLSFIKGGHLLSIDGMFRNCTAMTEVDLSGLKTTKPVKLGDAFRGMPNLKVINLGDMNVNGYNLYGYISLFASKKDEGVKRTASESKELTIKCNEQAAKEISGMKGFQNLRDGVENMAPVPVRFINVADGQEITPESK